MKYGFVLPRGDARTAANLAHAAERAGWDGFFVWEPVWGIDAWVALTAAAMVTEQIRLGTMLSPLSRMRPWKLAGEAATLDNLSGGRVIISVGLGAIDTGFAAFGEETDRRTRAELLDEGLEIMTGLWRGQPFSYQGEHYHIEPIDFFPPPPPVQQPRIPIWVVGAWPRPKSMRRVLKYDGLLPMIFDEDGQPGQAGPAEVREMAAYVAEQRAPGTPFDIVVEGTTPGDVPAEAAVIVREWADVGATWWIEAMWGDPAAPADPDPVRRRIEQGPPRID
jgi:hypothetical protein